MADPDWLKALQQKIPQEAQQRIQRRIQRIAQRIAQQKIQRRIEHIVNEERATLSRAMRQVEEANASSTLETRRLSKPAGPWTIPAGLRITQSEDEAQSILADRPMLIVIRPSKSIPDRYTLEFKLSSLQTTTSTYQLSLTANEIEKDINKLAPLIQAIQGAQKKCQKQTSRAILSEETLLKKTLLEATLLKTAPVKAALLEATLNYIAVEKLTKSDPPPTPSRRASFSQDAYTQSSTSASQRPLTTEELESAHRATKAPEHAHNRTTDTSEITYGTLPETVDPAIDEAKSPSNQRMMRK